MTGSTEGELSLDGAKDARAIKRLAGLHIFNTSYLTFATYASFPFISQRPYVSKLIAYLHKYHTFITEAFS